MTLVQLEYLIAVDTYRQLTIAANKCFISQPALSMQLQKLEEELGAKLFDRSRQPVVPTEIGRAVIEQARIVVQESRRITDIAQRAKDEVTGELRVGIIPTLAPYLLPLFLAQFLQNYPAIRLSVREVTTDTLLQLLKSEQLDVGIAVTPLSEGTFAERRLFHEEFVVYVAEQEASTTKQYRLPDDIEPDQLWLLEEGHCMRSQIMSLCELRKRRVEWRNFQYQAGSIEALKRMVERYGGLTILPELAIIDLPAGQQAQIRRFETPVPVREISLITQPNYVKQPLIAALEAEILRAVPSRMLQPVEAGHFVV